MERAPATIELTLTLSRSPDGAVVVAAAVAGALTDLTVRSGGAGLAAVVLVAAVAGLLLVVGRPSGRQAGAVVAAASVFGTFLAFRASPWLLPLDALAAGGLLALGASLARGGSLLDLSVPGLAARAVHAGLHGLAAPAFAWRALGPLRRPTAGPGPGPGDRAAAPGETAWMAALRGVALALPLVVVVGGLLASADVLFAHVVDFFPDIDDLAGHAVLAAAGAWGMAGLLRVAAATPPAPLPRRIPLVGPVEATVVLGSLTAIFAVFAATQLVALAGGGRHVVETAGLTYAEYARSGFFQLVGAAAVTLAALLAVDAVTDPADGGARRRLLVLSEANVALTLVVVASALRRLDLYENAYGLTMLRLYAAVLVAWVGVSLALLGVWVAAAGRARAWFPAAAAGAGLAALLALNLVNPEALVVRRNVDRAARTGHFDAAYLAGLSDDAVPEVVRSLPRLDPAGRADLLARLCSRPVAAGGGWAAWNAARDAAVEARLRVCGPPARPG